MPEKTTDFEIKLNGEPHHVAAASTVPDTASPLPIDPIAVAVERNKRIVPRSLHAETTLKPGDQIEVVTIVGGG